MPKIDINNTKYYYEIHGAGHPLIIIGGYTGDHFGLLPIAQSLSKHFKVLIFDNRGSGQTEDNGESLSADLLADDIMLLAKKLELKNPHIIGLSMGGAIAQSIAARYSNQISRLILTVATIKWRQATLLGFKSHIQMREKGLSFDEIFDATAAWVFGESFLTNKNAINALKQVNLTSSYPQSIQDQKRQYQILESFDGTELLSQIQAPTLVVHGTEDIIVLPPETRLMASKIRHAELVQFGCGHAMTVEIPDLIVAVFTQFLLRS
jgi:pimeloyl-ACP methyl ester carboxylesterase